MIPEDDWTDLTRGRGAQPANTGLGSLRMALLFGLGVVALALLVVPVIDRHGQQQFAVGHAQLDTMATGAIAGTGSYTVRRSVLQSSPNAVCIIQSNGLRRGDC